MSTNDRELLEMAAKACGIGALSFSGACPLNPFPGRLQMFWNPLNEDGDALRLLRTTDYGLLVEDGTVKIMNSMRECVIFVNIKGDDEMSVIRRAITEAAAEKGRRMP